MVGDLLAAPAVQVELEDFLDDLRLSGNHLELLLFGYDVAVGGGTDPFAVRPAALDDRFYFLAGVGNGHFVDEELKLDFQPVVVVWEVAAVPDGDNTDPGVPQVLQLHQPPAVVVGEPGEVLGDEDMMPHQFPPYGLVALPLLEDVAGTVPVLIEGQGAVQEPLGHKIGNNGFLVLNGGAIPVRLLVCRDAAVASDVISFNHKNDPFFLCR